MKTYKQFIFEGYEWSDAYRNLSLRYSLDGEIHFTESYKLNVDAVGEVNQEALERATFLLHMLAGTSYYKTYTPSEIIIKSGSLTQAQADFLDTVYRNGLGEYYAVNDLTPPDRIQFPTDENATASQVAVPDLKGALVPFGGGKDSIVTAELLKAAHLDITTWTVRVTPLLQPGLDVLGTAHLSVERTIDSKLSDGSLEGSRTGHVPITGILSALATVTAILAGKRDIVLSNESSAGEGNVEHHGLEVNHQYSKTLVFERLLQTYISENISSDIHYFSFLRPLSEIKIAEIFTGRYLDRYAGRFTSCNRNFKFGNDQPLSWCGKCPKCAFIYLIFAPFIPKAKLMSLFHDRNLFEDPDLETTYRELLGISGHKPFECVGEIKECRQAVKMALATGEWSELEKFEFPDFDYDYQQMGEHAMPDEYYQLLLRELET